MTDIPDIGLRGMACFLPPTRKAVADIFRDENISADREIAGVRFTEALGIETVHVAGDLMAAELGLHAARAALDEADVDPADLDLILDFTSIPEDYIAPTWSAAGQIQDALGAHRAVATAVNTGGCASFHLALQTALAWMRGDPACRTALLFSGDKTPPRNHTYFPITVICDGGGAVVLQRNARRRVVLAVETATVGQLHDVWFVPGPTRSDLAPPGQHLHMQCHLERFFEDVIPINLFMFRKVMRAVLKKTGYRMEDIDLFIYPTFSTWDLKSFCEGFRIPPEKVYTEGLARHGHLQETDMVLNYVDAEREGRVKSGDLVMLTTNGAGFTWGAALIRH